MRLFRPAWDSKNEKRAVKAVNKLKDETKLVHVAKEARCLQARLAAIGNKKLTDPNVLADIAKNDEDSTVSTAAFIKLISKNLIAATANYDENSDVRLKAVGSLDDQDLLVSVAKKARYSDARIAAVKKLTDPKLLVDVAKNAGYGDVRMIATNRVVDSDFDIEEDLLIDLIQICSNE